ncbi:MAG: hypothetical protein MUF59_02690 [Candidatus Krumholzibacteria bacterium]|jgi:outer membrane protein assembly factor BamB|nr:hypothetical protein [Candidatus Krumholzibacteria bacterium]
MTFSIKECGYPVEFANYQRNSHVLAAARTQWETAWSKSFSEVDPELLVSPRAVLAGDSIVAAKTASELFVYTASGKFKFMEALRNPTPVVLGAGAMAWFNEAQGLVYEDYNQRKLRPAEPVPGFDEWAYALLIKPAKDDLLAVIQNAGIRGQREKKFYIYDFTRGRLTKKWFHEFPGIVNHALLTADEKTLIVIVGEEATLYDVDSGKGIASFKTGLVKPFTASIDLKGDLVVTGVAEDAPSAKKFCRAYSPAGEALWSIELVNPLLVQPPVCGEEGYFYYFDNRCLICSVDGIVKWSTPPLFGDSACMTATGGNRLLVLDGALLTLFDPAGEKIFKSVVSKEEETFTVPPAVAADGAIYVMSDKNLYRLE